MRKTALLMICMAAVARQPVWAGEAAAGTAQSGTEAAPGAEEKAAPLRVWKNRKHPPVENPVFALGELLGGWSGRGWTTVDFAKLAVPEGEDPSEQVRVTGLFKKGTKVRFFRKGKRVGRGRAGDLIHSTEQMYGEHTLAWPEPLAGATVGISGDWDPYPLKAKRGNKQLVKDAVAELLANNGVKKPGNPVIRQVTQVDVDNDGVDDFFVVAQKKKAYLLVALLTPEKKRNLKIEFSKDEDEADSIDFVEIFDANGDGKMEILVESYGMESHSVVLYEVRGERVVGAFAGE